MKVLGVNAYIKKRVKNQEAILKDDYRESRKQNEWAATVLRLVALKKDAWNTCEILAYNRNTYSVVYLNKWGQVHVGMKIAGQNNLRH